MTCQEIINEFVEEGTRSYKKLYRNTQFGRALDRHETVEYCDQKFNSWAELGVFKTAQCIREYVPDVNLYVELDGNDSYVKVVFSEDEEKAISQERKLNGVLYSVLKEVKLV